MLAPPAEGRRAWVAVSGVREAWRASAARCSRVAVSGVREAWRAGVARASRVAVPGARTAWRAGVALPGRRVASVGVAIVAASAVMAGCGGSSAGGDGTPAAGAPVGTAVAIAQPADGGQLKAQVTPGGRLRVRTSVGGSARPGGAVYISASCRPQRCTTRARAGGDGRWSAAMTLTTTGEAHFVTIDAGSQPGGAAGSAVTTVELISPLKAPVQPASTTSRRSRSPAAGAPAPAPSLPHDVLVIGDSLAEGMAQPLAAALPGWTVRTDARIGRPLAEGMRILAQQPDPPAIIAYSLFTNDDPSATDALARAVQSTASRPGGCAVWATIVRPPYNGVSYDAANRTLEQLAGDPQLARGLRLADWAGVVAQSPSFVGGDGVHATPDGYRARAQIYADAIKACAGER
jgi:hypothetical protein